MFRRRSTSRPRTEATAARERAEAELEKTRRETPMIVAFARRLDELREINHIQQNVERTIRGRHA